MDNIAKSNSEVSQSAIQNFKQEAEQELFSILDYWMQYSVDEVNGGFFGRIDNSNNVDSSAPKGAVLNTRILYAFAAAYNQYENENYLRIATRAYEYIEKHFFDKEYGGVFWTVDAKGNIVDSRKQIYAQAFCIYGLSEYYAATQNKNALNTALQLYESIEEYSYDALMKGYLEAFTREWGEPDDFRLSEKDANEKKTMNTHLHIVEAYANLYKVHPSLPLKEKIIELLELFDRYFIDKQTFHLKLFFDEVWREKSNIISFGHDIEATWLLQTCAEIISDEKLIEIFKHHAIKITDATLEALDNDGGIWYEYDALNKRLTEEKHWWAQAEAMVGFFNAYQITNDKKYLALAFNNWQFIKENIIDRKNGEWFWGVKKDHSVIQNEDKVGLWKGPYHNSRACMQIVQRINKLQEG
ncbi:MAG TPA: AGE family epimerase/isomerase [Parafilimonas sp.]|nr:AGE family epimerase/isomerase [Parafilimonas sp.]